MSAPQLDRSCAAAVLALVDAAKVHAPGHELAWLVGWAMRASGELVTPPLPKLTRQAVHETETALRGSLPPPAPPPNGRD